MAEVARSDAPTRGESSNSCYADGPRSLAGAGRDHLRIAWEITKRQAVLAIMAAGFVLLARLVGLGFMADFLSRTALIGFLTGVGIQVALGEISGMLGMKSGGQSTLLRTWNDLLQIDEINVCALSITLSTLVVIVVSKVGARSAKTHPYTRCCTEWSTPNRLSANRMALGSHGEAGSYRLLYVRGDTRPKCCHLSRLCRALP